LTPRPQRVARRPFSGFADVPMTGAQSTLLVGHRDPDRDFVPEVHE